MEAAEGSTDGGPPLVDDDWLRSVQKRAGDGSGLLLCLDFDGTLAPIVDDPDEASMPRRTRRRLRRLARDPAVTVAVVSGRSLADLRERVGVDGIHYAGNHGLELGDGDDRRVPRAVRAKRPAVDEAVESLREELAGVDGCRVEDKALTATVHLRGVPTDRRAGVLATVQDVVESIDGVRTNDGKAIVEVRPDVEDGKGRVVDHLLEAHPDRTPLFVGDDVTDEDGFRAVADTDGGVLVGDRSETDAAVRVPGPDTVTLLLGWLLEACARDHAGTWSIPETPAHVE